MIDFQSSYINACVLEAALIRRANADSYVVQKCNDAALKSFSPTKSMPPTLSMSLPRRQKSVSICVSSVAKIRIIFPSLAKAAQTCPNLPKPAQGGGEGGGAGGKYR